MKGWIAKSAGIFLALSLASSAFAVPSTGAGWPPTLSVRLHALMPQQAIPAACCKVCRKGKACGDSCISKSKTCRKGPGCACDG